MSKVRVSRNKKTGAAKHYAFLEFASPEVAAIAAEAMDGYMLFTQARDAVKGWLWLGRPAYLAVIVQRLQPGISSSQDMSVAASGRACTLCRMVYGVMQQGCW